MIQIAIGSLYMFSVPRGYNDGFNQWCKQVIALCFTAFMQTTLMFLGLLTMTDGLFTDEGREVNLEEVSRELNAFEGTMWTAIISIKRDDAEKLGFDTGARWRNILRANRNELAKQFKIKPSSFQWYGAYHDESYHPHVHLIIYDKENKGYLSKDGVENIKSMFAHSIFQDEMFALEKEKSDRRDVLRTRGRDEIERIIERIKDGSNENVMLQALILDLSRRLRQHKGKKKYSYLKPKDRKLVNSIVDEIAKIPAIKELYDLWYEKQEELSTIYKTEMPPRLPLSANPAFKTIRNAVISAADEIDVAETEDYSEEEVIDIGGTERQHYSPTPDQETMNRTKPRVRCETGNVTLTVTRLLNNIGRIFRDQFTDYPEHKPKVDRKIWQKIREKEEAHGMKMG